MTVYAEAFLEDTIFSQPSGKLPFMAPVSELLPPNQSSTFPNRNPVIGLPAET